MLKIISGYKLAYILTKIKIVVDTQAISKSMSNIQRTRPF